MTSGLQRELLERVAALGDVAAASRERPRHLAHIHVTPRIDPDAVRCGKATGRDGVRPAPAGEHMAVPIVDADAARPDLAGRSVAARGLTLLPPELRDVGASLAVEHQVRRASRVGPLGEVLAVGTEDLDAIVFAVADEDAPVGGDGDAVRQEELTRTLARHSP